MSASIGGTAEWVFRKRGVVSVTVSAADRIVGLAADELRDDAVARCRARLRSAARRRRTPPCPHRQGAARDVSRHPGAVARGARDRDTVERTFTLQAIMSIPDCPPRSKALFAPALRRLRRGRVRQARQTGARRPDKTSAPLQPRLPKHRTSRIASARCHDERDDGSQEERPAARAKRPNARSRRGDQHARSNSLLSSQHDGRPLGVRARSRRHDPGRIHPAAALSRQRSIRELDTAHRALSAQHRRRARRLAAVSWRRARYSAPRSRRISR